MPTVNIDKITQVYLLDKNTEEKICVFNAPLIFDMTESEADKKEDEIFSIDFNKEFSLSLECERNYFYKMRNTFVANGKKKYRYKQIRKAMKL